MPNRTFILSVRKRVRSKLQLKTLSSSNSFCLRTILDAPVNPVCRTQGSAAPTGMFLSEITQVLHASTLDHVGTHLNHCDLMGSAGFSWKNHVKSASPYTETTGQQRSSCSLHLGNAWSTRCGFLSIKSRLLIWGQEWQHS